MAAIFERLNMRRGTPSRPAAPPPTGGDGGTPRGDRGTEGPGEPRESWPTALAALGWDCHTLDAIDAISRSRPPRHLSTNFPNALTVLRAGPDHVKAGAVVSLLSKLAREGPASGHSNHTGVSQVSEIIESCESTASTSGNVPTDPAPTASRSRPAAHAPAWPSLDVYDEAARLRVKIEELVDCATSGSSPWWYAKAAVESFYRSYALCAIGGVRRWYAEVVTAWVRVRVALKAWETFDRENGVKCKVRRVVTSLAG